LQELERVNEEKAKGKRKCVSCGKYIMPGETCIKNVASSWHRDCFVLRVLEITFFEFIRAEYVDDYDTYIQRRTADKV